MKINYMSRKMIALALAGIAIMTPLTACNYSKNENGEVELSSAFDYSIVRKFEVTCLKVKGKEVLYLTRHHGAGCKYYDIFTDKLIYHNPEHNEGEHFDEMEFVSSEGLIQYLIIYNKLKANYNKEDLEELYENIKNDYYSEIEKVKTYE